MASTKGQEGRDKHNKDRSGIGDEGIEKAVKELRRSFTEFRQENRPRKRIPDRLRDAALEAIQGGTPEEEVIRACGISRGLLERWREVKWGVARRMQRKASKARVFPVVEEGQPGRGPRVREKESARQLELRIGCWDISIRQNG